MIETFTKPKSFQEIRNSLLHNNPYKELVARKLPEAEGQLVAYANGILDYESEARKNA